MIGTLPTEPYALLRYIITQRPELAWWYDEWVPADQLLMPVPQAADLTGCNLRSLESAVRAGRVPSYQKDGRKQVQVADVDRWMRLKRRSPRPTARAREGS